MILLRSIRQQPALHAAYSLKNGTLIEHNGHRRRLLHNLPNLTHQLTYGNKGVPGLLSPVGFDVAWTRYQGHLIEKLNQLVQGTPDEYGLTKDLAIKSARQADKAAIFNYASMSHNNHFFFEGLSPHKTVPPTDLLTQITESFSSLSTLRTQFLATANAMFGPGFVWLIRKNTFERGSTSPGSLAILTTYIAGSPYPGAHARLQDRDMATTTTGVHPADTPHSYARNRMADKVYGIEGQAYGHAGSHGPHSASAKGQSLAPQGQDLDVLLAVNTWEHVWLQDYGVSGKKDFLERWWERIDWRKVDENHGRVREEKASVSGPRFLKTYR
ncbi:MAG: hypothetical protein MMC33_000499 [Icmadophila ericetorum]|nr:hypothetical protein [Icmadophila ericetorum]